MQPGMMIGPRMGLTRVERERFTIARLISAHVDNNLGELKEFRALSNQVGAITKQVPDSQGAFLMPGDTLGWIQRRDLTAGVGSAGGSLVDTEMSAFAQAMAEQSLVGVLPMQRLRNLAANVTITGESVRATAGWVYEGAVVSTGESTLGQAALTPKTVTSKVTVSRQLPQQLGPAAVAYVDSLVGSHLAAAADSALLFGTGATGQPTGISLAPGVDTRAGTSYAWSDATAMLKVCEGYAQGRSIAWVAGVNAAETLRKRERSAGSLFIAEDDRIANKLMLVSRAAPAASLTVTEWSKVWFADWGALEIMVDPFTDFKSGKVSVIARWLIDVAAERPQIVATATAVT